MERVIIAILFLLLVSGCSVKRHAVEDHNVVVISDSTYVYSSYSSSTYASKDSSWYDVYKNHNLDVHIVEYDTSVPADSSGKHPVKKEIVISSSAASSSSGGSVVQCVGDNVTELKDSTQVSSFVSKYSHTDSDVFSDVHSFSWSTLVFFFIVGVIAVLTFFRFKGHLRL